MEKGKGRAFAGALPLTGGTGRRNAARSATSFGVPAVGGNPRQERVGDIDWAPGANPIDRIGGDIRRVERPERGLEFEPPAKPQRVVLARRLVARLAAAGVKNKPASGGVAGQAKGLPFLNRIARPRRRERPGQRGSGGDDDRKDGGNPLHPRGRAHIRARANSSLSRFWPCRARGSRRNSRRPSGRIS